MTKDNEVLRGLSARIAIAVDLITTGETIKALSILQRLLKVLPKTSKNNVDAAMARAL
jgi:hypothetical protein